MRHLLILASLLFGTGAMADEADFDFKSLGAKKALRDYKKAVAKDEKARLQKAIEEEAANLAKKTAMRLWRILKALKQAMQAGNLEEANKIDAAIKALKKGASPAGASVAGSKGKKKAKKSKARIPRDAVKWNGHHYLLSDIIMSHPEAKERCENAGGHLVRIENAREQEFVARLASKGTQKSYWIDGSDRKREGDWLFSDGTRMKFFFGLKRSQSNWQGGEHYIQIITRHAVLEVARCAAWVFATSPRRGFICEWDE